MIIAVAASGNDFAGPIADRFGRAPGFFIVDTETGKNTYLNNSASISMGHGAGVQTTKTVAEAGAKAAIGPHFGPSAFGTLKAAGLRVFTASGSVEKAVEDYIAGSLQEVLQSDVQGHHGRY